MPAMFSASDAAFEMEDEKIIVPTGVHAFRCERIIEKRKDDSMLEDKSGDPYVLIVFKCLEGRGKDGEILKMAYIFKDLMQSENAERKLGMTRKFIGGFIEAAGLQDINKIDDLEGFKAVGRVTSDNYGPKITEWIKENEDEFEEESSSPKKAVKRRSATPEEEEELFS